LQQLQKGVLIGWLVRLSYLLERERERAREEEEEAATNTPRAILNILLRRICFPKIIIV